jgi:integrase
MLNQLARNHPTIFLGHCKSVINLRGTFDRQRKRIAAKLGNPRLSQIHFHTLRHWKATIEYYKTKDILRVMQLLGHKRIQNTLKYTQLAKFEETDGYVCRVAATKEDISALIEAGFEYVCEHEGLQFFKKPK